MQPVKGRPTPKNLMRSEAGCTGVQAGCTLAGEAKMLQNPLSPSAADMAGRCNPLAASIRC